jgi:hypothetical protein
MSMSGWGFSLTVVGLVAEFAGFLWVAQRIWKRQHEFGGPGPAYVHTAAPEWPPREMTLDERVGELEREHGELQRTVARADTDLHNEMASGLRRLGFGDVPGDWIALGFVALGVLLTLAGTILSYLA